MASHVANATGTMNVLDAARNHGNVQVIVASSSSVYGSNPTLPKHEELATRPLSPYGASKLATEAYTVAYGSTYGMKTLAFRFFNVFGPLQAAGHAYAAVVPAFIDAALKGTPLEIHGDGTQSRDFTFVGTVADTIATAVTEQISSNGPVNLAFGTRTSLLDLISMLEDQLGTAVERNHVAVRTGDVPHSQAANERLLALIPGIASVSLEEGLRETINWFQSEAAHQTNG
jgi:UDP-glucose 4-epimerase